MFDEINEKDFAVSELVCFGVYHLMTHEKKKLKSLNLSQKVIHKKHDVVHTLLSYPCFWIEDDHVIFEGD